MIKINEPSHQQKFPFSHLGFRPFFFVAGLSSSLLMFLWSGIYSLNLPLLKQAINPQLWHAHEMVFAYSMAVIVGFLLTAVKNWTNIQTLNGIPLMLLLGLWLIARVLAFTSTPLILQAFIDCSFLILATIFIASPLIQAKSWSNMGILSKVALMAITHCVFYLGLLGIIDEGVRWGLYGAFYLILVLIMVMLRRVLPFFIEKSLHLNHPLKNYLWLDRSSLVLFVLYVVFDVYWPSDLIYPTAFSLLLLHSIRLYQWHHPKLWKHPLLWVLYCAYCAITFAFALKIFSYFSPISPFLSLHSFAFGLGVITLGMMSRIILGHTGRDINSYPKPLKLAFILLMVSFIFRVLLPILNIDFYPYWISISQLLWAVSFTIFTLVYTPMLFQKRIDNTFG